MKRLAFYAVILACALTVVIAQQAGKRSSDQRSQPDHLGDDDGGMVQIVPAGVPTEVQNKARVLPVMKSVRQVSIFLGTAWAEQPARGRERTLADLSERLGELQNNRVKVLPAAPSVEDFSDLSRTPINDLAIQRKLTEMLNNKSLPAPGRETVYVVFLAAGVNSMVGGHKGGSDYAAYHSLIHLDAGEVRYVVVPFNESAETQAAAAARAMIQTAFNPKD
jgi:hypothetical protein